MPFDALRRRPGLSTLIEQLRECSLPCTTEAADILEGLIKSPTLVPDILDVDLNVGIATRSGVTVAVTPNQAVLLHVLNMSAGTVVPLGDLHKAIHGRLLPRTAKSNNNVRTQVNALRNKVAQPLSLTIRTFFNEGYSLELLPMTKEA